MNFTHEIKNNTLIIRLSGDLIGENNSSDCDRSCDGYASAKNKNVHRGYFGFEIH